MSVTVFVSNLPPDCTEEELRATLPDLPIRDARIFQGYGFLSFASEADAAAAMALSGKMIMHSRLLRFERAAQRTHADAP